MLLDFMIIQGSWNKNMDSLEDYWKEVKLVKNEEEKCINIFVKCQK